MNNVMRIEYKALSEADKHIMHRIKYDATVLWEVFDNLGASREISLAKTKLEEAVMWATKHITA